MAFRQADGVMINYNKAAHPKSLSFACSVRNSIKQANPTAFLAAYALYKEKLNAMCPQLVKEMHLGTKTLVYPPSILI